MTDETLRPALETFFARRIPDAATVRVTALREHTEGFSQETFSVDLEVDVGTRTEQRSYVIKREPEAGLLEPYDLEPEFRVLHALSHGDVLSPPTPWFERDPRTLGRPFYVMEKLPGEVPIPALRADGSLPLDDSERAALAPQVADQLARLHRIDIDSTGLDFLRGGIVTSIALHELQRWTARIEMAALGGDPMLERALIWLETHMPDDQQLGLVHGDYRLGNFLITRDGARSRLTGILDWEMAHAGDPIEDLGWLCSRMWRAQSPYASCLAEPARMVSFYERASGRLVDPERLRFWEVFSVVKMLAIMHTGIRAFLDRRTRDPRMAGFDHQAALLRALIAVELGFVEEM